MRGTVSFEPKKREGMGIILNKGGNKKIKPERRERIVFCTNEIKFSHLN